MIQEKTKATPLLMNDVCTENVANIHISDTTKALILLRARLTDIYSNIDDIISTDKDVNYSSLFEEFESLHMKLDEKVVKIINTRTEVVSLTSNYKEI